MRISALSGQAGLPVGTVKFYLRCGLLHHGRATSATQAQYDATHLARLRLIRALREVGGMSLEDIQRVLDAIDLPTDSPEASVAMVQSALSPPLADSPDPGPARAVVEELGWRIAEDSPALPHLARALAALSSIGVHLPPDRLRVYADAASESSRSEGAAVAEAAPEDRGLVAASAVLLDALLVALRRLADEHQRRPTSPADVPSPRSSSAA